MMKKIQKNVFTKNMRKLAITQYHVPLSSTRVNGMSQPPKKSVATIALTVTTLAYSAMKNIENFIALYSVWYPVTSSDSASGRSNGSRLVSAKPAMRQTKNEMKSGPTNQRVRACSVMIAENDTLPLRSSTGIRLIPMATS